MKISIGSHIIKGPWGGGNLFIINLRNYLIKKGHTVVHDLIDKDIDLILLTDPRGKNSTSSSFDHKEIEDYLDTVNPNTSVVHRINECDERKQTKGLNSFYLEASNVADEVVFVSNWLREIYLNLGIGNENSSVILSGADSSIFNRENSLKWKKDEKLKIITHHWSSNFNKGYPTYKELDNLIGTNKWKDKVEFTYVGNVSEDFKLNNTKIVEPKEGIELAKLLKSHHLYVTGSINEPSGNHHIEAAQCGLPILYLESGGITEYCENFGIGFTDDFELKLEKIIQDYDNLFEIMEKYTLSAESMCREYLELFEKLIEIKKARKINFKPGFKSKLYRTTQVRKKYVRLIKETLKNTIRNLINK